jgi:glutamate-1-semialdehyde aminotransferase
MNPLTAPVPTHNQIRETIEVIHKYGALVIFDEMVSGFRVAMGGMQEVWNVRPDLSCFGKAIANGFPLSALCGRADLLQRVPETCYGMTFEGECVSIAAARATLLEMLEKNVIEKFYDKGRFIRAEFNQLAYSYKLSARLTGYEPCMTLAVEQHGNISARELLWLMIQQLVRERIFTLGAFIVCFSHNLKDLRRLVKAFDSAMSVVSQAVDRGTTEGLLDSRIRDHLEQIKAPANWRRVGQRA